MDERSTRRAELKLDERTLRVRRRTVVAGVVQLAVSVVMISAAFVFRKTIGQTHYMETPGILLIFSGMLVFGMSFVLLARSPFRMPPGERLFRAAWLGPMGRAFVRLAGRGVARGSGGDSMSLPHVPVPKASLEARVAELERWRTEVATR